MQRDLITGPNAPNSHASHDRQPWRAAVKWTERIFFAAGVLLLGIYAVARIDSVLSSRAELRQFERLESSAPGNAPDNREDIAPREQADATGTDFSLWPNQMIEAYRETTAGRANAPLGVLRIAKVSLVAPILDGTDDVTLNHALGRIASTSRPGLQGNVGIAGHRDSFFRKLKDVREGDAIELQTLRGTDSYVVDQIQIVTPHEVDVLRPRNVPSLTLVTCYPFYYVGSAPQRYIVTAFLSEERKNGTGNSDSPAVVSQMQKGEQK